MRQIEERTKSDAWATRPLAKRLMIVLTLVFMSVFIWLAIFPPHASRIFLNHRQAVASIRDLNFAEQNYAARHKDAGFACSLGDLSERGSEPLSRAGLEDRLLASGTKSGYHFDIRCPQNGDQRATAYTITALPDELRHTGTYALCTDQTGEIWYSETGSSSDCLRMHKPVEPKYK